MPKKNTKKQKEETQENQEQPTADKSKQDNQEKQQQDKQVLIQQIARLQNAGVFRTELLYQMIDLNTSLKKIAELLEKKEEKPVEQSTPEDDFDEDED